MSVWNNPRSVPILCSMRILNQSMEVKTQHPVTEEGGTRRERVALQETKILTWFNLFLITLVVFNTTFSTTLLIKYYNVAVENTIVLEKLLFERQYGSTEQKSNADPDSEMFGSLKAKWFDSNRDCPPCPTTEPPTDVIVNKDPVSVLNTKFGALATYDCVYHCKVPPIHDATVHIEDHDKTYTGRARTKQGAKHEAAYKAIQEGFPELLEEVVHESVIYDPSCTDAERNLLALVSGAGAENEVADKC